MQICAQTVDAMTVVVEFVWQGLAAQGLSYRETSWAQFGSEGASGGLAVDDSLRTLTAN